ncbi:neutral/alkaline non-lysosomal ceramidase N-terminal domain-containing protein [Cyclobacterium roseum]|uniref:neutral/alkaline non-lysosomal ceramidase N-terminal domain-containing protein n=1 Tax=Cyclobacterium roseum TaxID=2666137 RepID=UPI001390AD0F|nr:neutral/alkaline non-lysosomal ceramidase N-terminal domain-containing protein [Cyclobacterium roseum]
MPLLRLSIIAIAKFLLYLAGFFLLLILATITTVDWTPYQEKGYYKETMATLDSLHVAGSDQGFLLGGWAKANMTPATPVPLVAYRPRGNYEFVQDSSFVKAVILGNSDIKIAFLNYELLIVHPRLAETLRKEIKERALPIDHVYFTATHTHSGMGGTIPGPVGSLALGGWNQDLVDLISASTVQALQEAFVQMDTVQLDYSKSNAENFVTNRLVATDPVDPYIRQLTLRNPAGESASLVSYSAHATCLSSRFMGLSGDYPFYFSQKLEERHDLVLFAAGAVGSHRPHIQGNDVKSVKAYAAELDSMVDQNREEISEPDGKGVFAAKLPLQLREPHFRISNDWRIRPWLFDWAIGDYPAHFDLVKIGNTLFISSSGEVSGVFYEAWEKQAADLGMNLFITTFNGGYIGYITPDKYYQENYYEVRDMNFYGPYNGAYFKEVIGELIDLGAGL